ncbi:MAG: DUF11 domain-containing protein [Burkholderiales bacterium]|jgi:uncharacterized repeat protein (TIGR01451 family)|nr:DUF11 domain-containing protein [Burkholderiales bacterium]
MNNIQLPFSSRLLQTANGKLLRRKRHVSRHLLPLLSVFGWLLSGAAYAQSADLSVNHAFSPASGLSGISFTSTFTVSNVGPDAADNVKLTNVLPEMQPPSVGGTAAFVSYPPECTLSDTTLICDFGTMAFGDTKTVAVVYTLGGNPGVWNSTGTVSSTTTDPLPANNSMMKSVTTTDSSDLELTASGPDHPLIAGSAFQYSLQVKNLGPNPVPSDGATIVQFTVPEKVRVTDTADGWQCAPETGDAGTLITCKSVGAWAVSDTKTLTIDAVALGSLSSAADTHFTLSAVHSDGSALPDPNLSNNNATVSVEITAGTDAGISKTVAVLDEYLVYTLTPRYNGGDLLTDVTITITDSYNPEEFTFVDWVSNPSVDGWNCSLPSQVNELMNFTCTRNGFSGGNFTDMPSIKFTATAKPSAMYATNVATISLTGRKDPIPDNDSSSVVVNTSGLTDMEMRKSASFTPVVVGQDFQYLLSVKNLGPWNVPSEQTISVTDTLPGKTMITGEPTGNNWTCSVSNNGGVIDSSHYPVTSTTENPVTVRCEYRNGLNVGNTAPAITLPARITEEGAFRNSACASLAPKENRPGWREELDPSNNCVGTEAAATQKTADLEITKTAKPDPVDAGSPLTYTLKVTNHGPDEATKITLTDVLPSLLSNGGLQNVTITTNPGGSGTCSVDGKASPGFPMNGNTHILTCAFPSLPRDGQAVIDIVVLPTIAFSGPRSNTATVYSTEVGDLNRKNNEVTITSQVNEVYDLTVTTWATSAGIAQATQAPANSVVTFTSRVSSIGPSTAPTAKVTIKLPENASFVRLGSAGGGVCTPAPDPLIDTVGGTLVCEWTDGIPSGAYREVSYLVMAPSTVGSSVISTSRVGLINPGAHKPESDLNNNDASAQVTITPAKADIQVTINDAPDPVLLGEMTTYTIDIRNNGPSLATDVVLASAFVSMTGVFSYQGSLNVDQSGVCTEPPAGVFNGKLVCAWPSLASGAAATVTYTLRTEAVTLPNVTGVNLTSVTGSATEEDSHPGNDADEENTTAYRLGPANPGADLGITKTASKTNVAHGNLFEYVITVHNYGPAHVTPSQGAQIIDVLPEDLSLTEVPSGCSYVDTTRTLTCLIGGLQSGDDYAVTVPVNVETYGNTPIINKAVVDMPDDLDPSNNEAEVTVTRLLEKVPTLSPGGLVLLTMLLLLAAIARRWRGNPSSLLRNH